MTAALSRILAAAVCAPLIAVSVGSTPADAAAGHHRHHRHHHHARRHHRQAPLPSGLHVRRFFDHPTRSVIHVAAISPGAHVRFRPVPASVPLQKGALVRTSTMCRRVHCLVAVNGSFRDLPSRLPRGAEVVNGMPVRLHAHESRQAILSPRRPVGLGRLTTRIRLHQAGVGSVHIGAVNVRPGSDGAALFTSHYGRRSPRGYVARVVLPGGTRLHLGHSYRVRVHSPRRHAVRSLHGGRRLTLVTHGRRAHDLRAFLRHVRRGKPILLSSTSPAPSAQSLGTSFRLLHDSHQVVPSMNWRLIHGRNPRTLLAVRPNGTVLLITIDGRWRRHSAGATLPQAAALARRLGAIDAVNLDGGGSTTFVERGRVLNRPSDGRERGVVNALAVVRDPHAVFDPKYLQRIRAERRAAARRAAAAAAAARRRFRTTVEAARLDKLQLLAMNVDGALLA